MASPKNPPAAAAKAADAPARPGVDKLVVLSQSFDLFVRGDVIDVEKAGPRWRENLQAGRLRVAREDERGLARVTITEQDLSETAGARLRRLERENAGLKKDKTELERQLAEQRSEDRVQVLPADYEAVKAANAEGRQALAEAHTRISGLEAELLRIKTEAAKAAPPIPPAG